MQEHVTCQYNIILYYIIALDKCVSSMMIICFVCKILICKVTSNCSCKTNVLEQNTRYYKKGHSLVTVHSECTCYIPPLLTTTLRTAKNHFNE